MSGPAHNPDRSEEPWFNATIDQLAELRGRLEDKHSATSVTANGLVGALIAKDFDGLSFTTAAKYRKLLREIGPPNGRPVKVRRRTGARGAVALELVSAGTLAGAGATMAVSGAPWPLTALVGGLAPIILDPPDDDAQTATQGLAVAA